MLQLAALRPGDLVFVFERAPTVPGKLATWANVAGQEVLARLRKDKAPASTRRLPVFSHVMVGLGGGLVIHADGSVKIELASNALHIGRPDVARFEVWRRPDLAAGERSAIARAALRYFNQTYRFSTYFATPAQAPASEEDTTQFCSRLAAYAFRTAGLALSNRPDHRVLPRDLYRACQAEPWRNVTAALMPAAPGAQTLASLERFFAARGRSVSSTLEQLQRVGNAAADIAAAQQKLFEQAFEVVKARWTVQEELVKLAATWLMAVEHVREKRLPFDADVAHAIEQALRNLPRRLDQATAPDLGEYVEAEAQKAGRKPEPLEFVKLTAAGERELRVQAEVLRLCADLLLCELGMLALLACLSDRADAVAFPGFEPRFAHVFADTLPDVPRLATAKKAVQRGFTWMLADAERERWRGVAGRVVGCLQTLEPLRPRPAGQGTDRP